MNAEQAREMAKSVRLRRVERILRTVQSEIEEAVGKGDFSVVVAIPYDGIDIPEDDHIEIVTIIKGEGFNLESSSGSYYLTLGISWGEEDA
ncbi:hypothetical protein [Geomicrobium sediminis]|uniref:Uncharacterized protein n=1 Tax=Geomicrobium sediminis TaxID=1347788 RepID=A0ABS2PF57_9BACL|nr:hypothetical protein [Geomicrobium sediminis]MBM7634035.1 hypothetical protein [Geomicrobium sediminis]